MFRFTLKSSTTLPIELAGITPDELSDKSLGEVERLCIWHGRTQIPLADLFVVGRDDAADRLEFIGDLASGIGLGAGMKSGSMRIEGHAGRHVGLGMWGGEIEVTGNADDGLGMEMRGGIIRVRGSAGMLVGAAQIGSARGMTGGAILIDGNAGDSVGTRMRRGLIAIGGDAGDLVGHNMLAGTIAVGGECGRHVGAGMSRGTIALCQKRGQNYFQETPALGSVRGRENSSDPFFLPTFRYACLGYSPMLGLVGRELQALGFENDVWNANRTWRQFNGDFLVSGRGEVFLATC